MYVTLTTLSFDNSFSIQKFTNHTKISSCEKACHFFIPEYLSNLLVLLMNPSELRCKFYSVYYYLLKNIGIMIRMTPIAKDQLKVCNTFENDDSILVD